MAPVLWISLATGVLLSGAVAWVFFGKFSPQRIDASTFLVLLEAVLALAFILGPPFAALQWTYDPELRAYAAGHDWFLPLAVIASFSGWRGIKHYRGKSQSAA